MVEVLTVQEVALILKLHPRTVMKMAISGEIPAAKVGRQWRFERNLIEDWLAVRMAPNHGASSPGRSSLSPSGLLSPAQTLLLQPPPRREEILPLLASRIHSDRPFIGQEELIRLLQEREAMFSTATELGVAFPHPRHPISTLETPLLVLAVVPDGLDFGAPGDVPTHAFVLSCSPDDRTHVYLLSLLARIFRRPGLVKELCRCSSPGEVLDAFTRAELAALSDQIERAQGSRQ